MDYRTWNRMEPGTIVKTSQGALYEVQKCSQYIRGRPLYYEAINLLETAKWGKPVHYTLSRYCIKDYEITHIEDKSYKAIITLFGKG